MIYSLEEQENLDIDWFFIDKNCNICHVASAGGKLPKIAISKEVNQELSLFFKSLPIISHEVTVCPTLTDFVSFDTEESKNNYLTDFLFFAKRGLFSFDKTLLGQFESYEYHLVVSPIKKVSIDNFPKDIINILSEIDVDDVSKLSKLSLSEFI